MKPLTLASRSPWNRASFLAYPASPRSGQQIVAHGASRGKSNARHSRRAPAGRKKSRPNVSLVIRNAVLLEKRNKLFLERHAAVMRGARSMVLMMMWASRFV